MKELFESAELEVMILSNDDIITGSPNSPIDGGEGTPDGGDGGDF